MKTADYIEAACVFGVIALGLFAFYCDMCRVSGYMPFWERKW